VLEKQLISHDCRYRDNRGRALKSPEFDHIRHSQRTCEHHTTNRHCALQRASIRDCLLIIQGMPKAYPVRSPTHPNHLSAVLRVPRHLRYSSLRPPSCCGIPKVLRKMFCQFVRHLGSWKVFSELTATKSLTLRISQGGNYKGYVKKVFPPPL
jgi:hypothetical protein